ITHLILTPLIKKDRTKENVLSLNSFFIDIDCVKKRIINRLCIRKSKEKN
ncbi:hypothetical protein HMPREF9088_2370, partial [Enterococcus italicus DSM 15952]